MNEKEQKNIYVNKMTQNIKDISTYELIQLFLDIKTSFADMLISLDRELIIRSNRSPEDRAEIDRGIKDFNEKLASNG